MFNRLKFRIFLLMIAVSIPAAALVSFLAYRAYLSAQRSELASLGTVAEIVALNIEENLSVSRSLTNALAQTFVFRELTRQTCEAQLRGILDRNAKQAALYVFKDRQPFCGVSNAAELKLQNFSWPATANEENNSGFFNYTPMRTAIWVSRRIDAPDASYVIFTLSSDASFEEVLRRHEGGNGRFSAIVTASNRLLAASSDQARQLHEPTLLDASWLNLRVTRRSADADAYVYLSHPLSSVDARVIIAQPERLLFSASGNQFYLAILTSLLMLLLPIAAIWWGIDRLVLRWLGQYSRVTSAYVAGDQSARMTDHSSVMPYEISQVAQSFNLLADSVAARTNELEQEISRKQAYVRELHHRVKNILQMIASMLAMEAREASGSEAEGINRASRRIAALGATYAIFYGYSERGKAPLATVLNEAVSRLGLGAPVRAVNYEASGDFEANVDLDISIAITMLMAEYISAYLQTNEMGSVNVTTYIGKMLEVHIDAPSPPQISVLATRFISAYLRQLGGTQTDNGTGLFLKIKLSGLG